ncbi:MULTISPECIES: hypothetical protein [unclassified Vibrio]|uniref:hypothetical protein n=1 Tax=unclassified Vibrio TaxID=2614977 RepID=UPI000C828DFD|nr:MULTISPECIES: hypothetical protein [unclassified Vibrio]PMI95214.1 hypothetical protein BCU34_19445 [Vibrio sp. 10N.286.45.E10]PTQ19041.1 hypothetical protein CWO24_23475 [Vibrio sp. 10N.286.46.E10]
MTKNSSCNICSELTHEYDVIQSEEYKSIMKSGQNILLETESFCVIPSFGPLHKSHVMIVPKVHINNFALLEDNLHDELTKVISKLRSYYFNSYGKQLLFFESGAGTYIDHSGGCIVHAHIHCVLYEDKFECSLTNELNIKKVVKRSDLDTKNGYVWFLNENNQEFFYNRPLLPSQFLRFLYLTSKGSKQRWNWRRDIDIEGIKEVITTYSGLS